MRRRRVTLLAALACLTPGRCAGVVHATFGRTQGMALCRRWATALQLPTGDMEGPNSLVRARMALEHPSAFLVAAGAVGEDVGIVAFVCVPVGRSVHRVDAVVWPNTRQREDAAAAFGRLRAWHGDYYPDQCLACGTLPRAELAAWRGGREA